MNGKQSRMLRQMMADKADIIKWKSLSGGIKGKLRLFHETNEKACHFSFQMAMRDILTTTIKINKSINYKKLARRINQAGEARVILSINCPGGQI